MRKKCLFALLLIHRAVCSPAPENPRFLEYQNTDEAVEKIPNIAIAATPTNQQKFILLTSLYNETNLDRVKEYIYCLEKNLAHPNIERVHVIYDTSADTDKNILLDYIRAKQTNLLCNIPIDLDPIKERPTYGTFFDLANQRYLGRKIILSNADIYFNETLTLLTNFNLNGIFLALTRWNVTADGHLEIFKQYVGGKFSHEISQTSQDVWIFETPIRKFANDGIQPGIMGCDAAIVHEARMSGLQVFNLCLTIQACHLHLTGLRNYNTKSFPYRHYPLTGVPWVTFEEVKKQ